MRVAALLAAAAAIAAGCDSVGPPRRVMLEPSIVEATAPDSLAAGDSLVVSVRWAAGGCKRFFAFRAIDDDPRALRLYLYITDAIDATCTADVGIVESVYTFAPPPSGDVRLTVGKARPIEFMIRVGAP